MPTLNCACERAEDHAEDADTLRRIAASANRIDAIIAAFAFGVILGMWIA